MMNPLRHQPRMQWYGSRIAALALVILSVPLLALGLFVLNDAEAKATTGAAGFGSPEGEHGFELTAAGGFLLMASGLVFVLGEDLESRRRRSERGGQEKSGAPPPDLANRRA